MRVTHIEDKDTHAVIGGSNVMEFGIAQTAEFFTVLSDTMYSDKPRAVVREVLCNGWDSHIASGKQHIPLEVTVSDSELIIRDFGTGIDPNKIHGVYCVYGSSTKEHDGRQTGGFGLGSKAPFAYSDHFSVSNYHNGRLTVYAVSKGSALTQGKPDMRVMASIATTETGLCVTVPIKNKEDKNRFISLITEIASFGEMNVNLNGKRIPVVPISRAENNLFITRGAVPSKEHRIFIRYGNVVYPVSEHEEYSDIYNEVHRAIIKIPDYRENKNSWYINNDKTTWAIILQAAPNTISITPSRESLSMTETTTQTIKELLTNIAPHLDWNRYVFQTKVEEHLTKAIDKAWLTGQQHQLLTSKNIILDMEKVNNNYVFPMFIHNVENLSSLVVLYGDYYLTEKQINRCYQSLIDGKYPGYKKIKLWMKAQNSFKTGKNRNYNRSIWLKKHIHNPVLKKLAMHKFLQPKSFQVCQRRSYNKIEPMNISSIFRYDYLQQLLRNIIFITPSKAALYDYFEHFNKQLKFSKDDGFYFYTTNRSKNQKEQAPLFFEKQGFIVIDIHEYVEKQEAIQAEQNKAWIQSFPVVPPKPKLEGIPVLDSLIFEHCYDMRNFKRENVKRITNPLFVFQPHRMSGYKYDQRFFKFSRANNTVDKAIVDLWGPSGGICVSEPQRKKYLENGAKDGYEWITEKLVEEFKNNPRIKSAYQTKHPDIKIRSIINALRSISEHSPLIKNKINLPELPNSVDEKYILIYDAINDYIGDSKYRGAKNWEKPIIELRKEVQNWNLEPNTVKLAYNIIINEYNIAMLNLSKIQERFDSYQPPVSIEELIRIEMILINAFQL